MTVHCIEVYCATDVASLCFFFFLISGVGLGVEMGLELSYGDSKVLFKALIN